MAQGRPDTPEKQLLKLIENPKSHGAQRKRIERKGLHLFSFGALKGRLSFLSDKLKIGFLLKKPPVDIALLNKVLAIGIILLSVYLVSSMTLSVMRLNRIPNFTPEAVSEEKPDTSVSAYAVEDLLYYLDKPQSRNIFDFKSAVSEVEVVKEIVEEDTVRAIDTELESLRLAGIAWSDDPDAMVENTDTKEMFFLKRGDLVDGKLKVERIFRDKVVFSYQGDEAELK